jgi:hypothetical protein
MKIVNALLVAGLGSLAITAAASADTVATFADPAAGASTPLFQFNAGTGTLTGGWSGANLLLQTPGLPSVPDFANSTFTMTPLSAIGAFGNIYHLAGGQINFFDSASNPLLTITFGDAWLTGSLGLGASDFMSNSVVFTGPIVSGYGSVSNEAFSFSFANPVATTTGFTTTSSFTSSANLVVPAPGAAALLGLGGLVANRRRRR